MTPDVYKVELSRERGKYQESIRDARLHSQISTDQVNQLTLEEVGKYMRFWRVWAGSLISLSKQKWSGEKAASLLFEARDVIGIYFYNPHAWELAKKISSDPEGHEYQMAPEVCRDEGRYLLAVASLTGNPSFVKSAIESFDEAISLSEQHTSAIGVATMEKQICQRYLGEKINFPVFTEAYNTVVDLYPNAGGLDRLAATSWWYTKEAIISGKIKEAQVGIANLRKACGKNWINYPLKDIVSTLKTVTRRVGAENIDPDRFKLPY